MTSIHHIVDLQDVSLALPSRAGLVEILRGVSLRVAQGESVAVVGPSGSGKTTLLMVTAGLERPSAGSIKVAGEELSAMSEDGLARLRGRSIGIVFQSFHLVPTMTALENVALPLEFGGVANAQGRAEEILRDVGLGPRVHHFPAQLSGGEQQRVALARALAIRPKLLLADEPTGNLDTKTGQNVIELMFDLHRRQGITLILVTHDPNVASKCGRIVRMADGKITQDVAEAVTA
ncbi:MAG: ABC transporter ATP-binding protein [Hyphomicrobiaceae bacterium]|nr:MAG: ABC transporter ATP-binding protein [Hyphomicrobiaceae bacterium]